MPVFAEVWLRTFPDREELVLPNNVDLDWAEDSAKRERAAVWMPNHSIRAFTCSTDEVPGVSD